MPATVIGSGGIGLLIAARLEAQGHRVTVFERDEQRQTMNPMEREQRVVELMEDVIHPPGMPRI